MLKVIVLEDEPNLRKELVLFTPWQELGFLLAGEGENGKEGLDLIQKYNPDIVLTDIRMPEMDGLQMIQKVQETMNSEPQWIIISGYTEFEYARKAMQLGVQEYLLKPVENQALEEALIKAKEAVYAKNQQTKLNKIVDAQNQQALAFFRTYGSNLQGKKTVDYVKKAVEIIQERYIQGITIEETAEILKISTGYLSRLFRQETGYTFMDYLMYTRVTEAAKLLTKADSKIYEVADMVGYTDARYFSQVFKRVTGLTPREFKDGKE